MWEQQRCVALLLTGPFATELLDDLRLGERVVQRALERFDAAVAARELLAVLLDELPLERFEIAGRFGFVLFRLRLEVERGLDLGRVERLERLELFIQRFYL